MFYYLEKFIEDFKKTEKKYKDKTIQFLFSNGVEKSGIVISDKKNIQKETNNESDDEKDYKYLFTNVVDKKSIFLGFDSIKKINLDLYWDFAESYSFYKENQKQKIRKNSLNDFIKSMQKNNLDIELNLSTDELKFTDEGKIDISGDWFLYLSSRDLIELFNNKESNEYITILNENKFLKKLILANKEIYDDLIETELKIIDSKIENVSTFVNFLLKQKKGISTNSLTPKPLDEIFGLENNKEQKDIKKDREVFSYEEDTIEKLKKYKSFLENSLNHKEIKKENITIWKKMFFGINNDLNLIHTLYYFIDDSSDFYKYLMGHNYYIKEKIKDYILDKNYFTNGICISSFCIDTEEQIKEIIKNEEQKILENGVKENKLKIELLENKLNKKEFDEEKLLKEINLRKENIDIEKKELKEYWKTLSKIGRTNYYWEKNDDHTFSYCVLRYNNFKDLSELIVEKLKYDFNYNVLSKNINFNVTFTTGRMFD